MGNIVSNRVSFLLIGNGHVAKHMACYFETLGLSWRQWFRKSHNSLQASLESTTHVLLLIPESAIDDFVRAHPELQNKVLVHFSGCLVSSYAMSAHPLMTFSDKLFSADFYSSVAFVTRKEEAGFDSLLPGLPNPHHVISVRQASLYHCLCVMANNFTQQLWVKCISDMQDKLGIPQQALWPFLEKTVENIQSDPGRKYVGPFARQDFKTIEDNLLALRGDSFQSVYEAFVKQFKEDVMESEQNERT